MSDIKERLRAKLAASEPVSRRLPKGASFSLEGALAGSPFTRDGTSAETFHNIMIASYREKNYELSVRAMNELVTRARETRTFHESMKKDWDLICRNMWFVISKDSSQWVSATCVAETPPKKVSGAGAKVERVDFSGKKRDITTFVWGSPSSSPTKVRKMPVIAIYCYSSSMKWDPSSVKQGIPGSEEAVIYASQVLVEMGFRVFVYASPPEHSPWSLPASNPCYLQERDYAMFPTEGIFDAIIMWRRSNAYDLTHHIEDIMRDREITVYKGHEYKDKLLSPFPVVKKGEESVIVAAEEKKEVVQVEGKKTAKKKKSKKTDTPPVKDEEKTDTPPVKEEKEEEKTSVSPVKEEEKKEKDECDKCESKNLNKVNTYLWVHDIAVGKIEDRDLHHLNGVFYLSDYQRDGYHAMTPGLREIPHIISGNGIVPSQFEGPSGVKDNPFSCVYVSNWSRGLSVLIEIWPQIVAAYPTATLTIAYGRETFGTMSDKDLKDLGDKVESMRSLRVREVGKLSHQQLVELGKESSYLLYPCTTSAETYCISLVKMLACECECIITHIGAMKETAHPLNPSIPSITNDEDKKAYLNLVLTQFAKDAAHPEELVVRRRLYKEWALRRTWKRCVEMWVGHMFPGIEESKEK